MCAPQANGGNPVADHSPRGGVTFDSDDSDSVAFRTQSTEALRVSTLKRGSFERREARADEILSTARARSGWSTEWSICGVLKVHRPNPSASPFSRNPAKHVDSAPLGRSANRLRVCTVFHPSGNEIVTGKHQSEYGSALILRGALTTYCQDMENGDTRPAAPEPRTPLHLVNTESETAVVKRAVAGDGDAFATLFQLHRGRVYAVCLRMTNNPADADDLTQEAFIQAFRKLNTFRGESALSTWLHRVAVNTALMHFRKRVTVQSSLDGSGDVEAGKRELGRQDPRLNYSLDRIALKRALEALPFGYRTIFELHEFHGYGHREIAKILHCTVGNSKSQLHKAKQRIRECLVSRRHLARRMRETMHMRETTNHQKRWSDITLSRTFAKKEASSHCELSQNADVLTENASLGLGFPIQGLAATTV